MCGDRIQTREYSRVEVIVNNLPYTTMIVLGGGILALGLQTGLWAWTAAGAYFAYGLAGAFWIIIFLCPYCSFHGMRSCPCGYGGISAKLRPRQGSDCFREMFRKHIPVIVPLWFIPLLVGGVVVTYRFSWWFLGLLIVFALDAFLVLPLVSTKHGCATCPQKDKCPWMGLRRRGNISPKHGPP